MSTRGPGRSEAESGDHRARPNLFWGASAPGTTTLLAGLLAILGLTASLAACGPPDTSTPASLRGPVALDVAERQGCGAASPVLEAFAEPGGRCSIGLIANANSNRLAIADMGRAEPTLFDLDPSLPSVSHLQVGERPVDVAASGDGTAAYVLNAADGDISVVDLWRLETTAARLQPPGTPVALAARPDFDDAEAAGEHRLVVALDDPNALWLHGGVTCEESAGQDEACTGLENEDSDSATTLPTPGVVTDLTMGPRGRRMYTVYRDKDWMSVWALPTGESLADRGLECVNGGTSAPCEVGRVGLRWECADGLDNDGDGQVDRDDTQCYGPKGAESPDGIGRSARGACGDGVDNDEDGQVDRADEDCLLAAGDSEETPLVEDAPEAPCSDGADNDGDGQTDWPADPGCYGPNGRSEKAIDITGFDGVDVGSMGRYVYVISQGDAEVLVVDADRMSLIDAAQVEEPPGTAFTDALGIPVGRWPAAVDGVVRRRVAWTDPDDPSHGIVRYLYGAWTASDDGNAYFAHTATAYCEVEEVERADLLRRGEFRLDSEAFRDSRERHCVTTPALPIEIDQDTEACQAVEACETCQQGGGDGDESTPRGFDEMCLEACENFQEQYNTCRTQGRLLEPTDGVRVTFNPRMSLRDARPDDARLAGSGTCQEPDAYLDELRAYSAENPEASDDLSCVSALRPQPLGRTTSAEQLGSDAFEEVPRADLLERPELILAPGDDGAVSEEVTSRPWDNRIRSESWTVSWEGVLPATRRDDGLLDDEEEGVLAVGGLNLCEAGVRVGDRLQIQSDPDSGDEAPERCEDFTNREQSGTWRTWRVAQVRPRSLTLELIDEPEGENRYADTLPGRECFPTGISYQIRPDQEWTVIGEQSGYLSDRTSAFGACVPRFGAQSPRRSSRVESGRLFTGPYLDFVLYDGPVEPLRRPGEEFSYDFQVRRFFDAERIDFSPENFTGGGVLPSTVRFFPTATGGRRLLVGDSSNDFMYVRNLDRTGEGSVAILR